MSDTLRVTQKDHGKQRTNECSHLQDAPRYPKPNEPNSSCQLESFHIHIVCSNSPSDMPRCRCSRIEQRYSRCGHQVCHYKFCGHSHDNTHEKREECYNTLALPAPTTQKPLADLGNCPNCKAEKASWDCWCKNVMEAGSVECDKCQDDVCLDCITGEN